MEESISMPELTHLLITKREKDYEEKKFFAAIQGVDLDKEVGKSDGQKEWEDIKARVFSGGTAQNSNDVISLQGANADKAGFGIGQGLEYQVVKNPKNPMS
jgi:translation initiation factor 1 (eIF-1/SUI1)